MPVRLKRETEEERVARERRRRILMVKQQHILLGACHEWRQQGGYDQRRLFESMALERLCFRRNGRIVVAKVLAVVGR